MGEFRNNDNYAKELNLLRKSTKDYPLELQLVWLFEILMILTYIAHVRKHLYMKYNTDRDTYVITQSKCVSYVSRGLRDADVMSLLAKFRDAYVHEGSLSDASRMFQELVDDHKDALRILAGKAQINLNFGFSMYEYKATL